MYKFLFIITSSIIPFKVGSYHSSQERFEQTLETVKSIREKVPNAIVWITESSECTLPKEYSDKLIKISDYYDEYYSDYTLQKIYKNLNENPEKFDFGKSLLETRSLQLTFNKISQLNVNRIFKISGRYALNNNFEIQNYETNLINNRYILQVHQFGNDIYDLIYGIKGQITTGLWSFDKSLLKDTIKLYEKCFSYMDTMMCYTNGIDIEHSLYKFIDFSKIISTSILGVTRNHGPSGEINCI